MAPAAAAALKNEKSQGGRAPVISLFLYLHRRDACATKGNGVRCARYKRFIPPPPNPLPPGEGELKVLDL